MRSGGGARHPSRLLLRESRVESGAALARETSTAKRRSSALPRADEGFFARVYTLVARVPRGRVVTYGQVARLVGVPSGARAVGWALRALAGERAERVPWHRVVGHGGRISLRDGQGPALQRLRLLGEGVRFRGPVVDLARHAWDPRTPAAKNRAGTRRRVRPPVQPSAGSRSSARARRRS